MQNNAIIGFKLISMYFPKVRYYVYRLLWIKSAFKVLNYYWLIVFHKTLTIIILKSRLNNGIISHHN